MKRNLDTVMTDLDGNPFADGATLKTMVFMALSANLEGDDKMDVTAKMKQYGLLQRVHKGDEIDLTAEEISTIKGRAAKAFAFVAFGRMVELLEQEPTTVAPPGKE